MDMESCKKLLSNLPSVYILKLLLVQKKKPSDISNCFCYRIFQKMNCSWQLIQYHHQCAILFWKKCVKYYLEKRQQLQPEATFCISKEIHNRHVQNIYRVVLIDIT